MRYLFFLPLFFSLAASAQWKEYKLTSRGDTINRVDHGGRKQGPWILQVAALRGEPAYTEEGIMVDDKKELVWRRFSDQGDCIAIETYHLGMKHGKCQYFLNSGEPLREENWRAIDPKSPYDTVAIRDLNDPSKIVRYEIQKVEPNSYKHGTWTYYNTINGAVDYSEQYVMNRLKEEIEAEQALANDDMSPSGAGSGKATTAKKNDAPKEKVKPKEVMDFEKKNSGKKKVRVRDGNTGG